MSDSKKCKISIIIPVYNVESYIAECLDRILQQTFQSYEVILINDGSTDNSYGLCQSYALMDSRIKVFSQENLGSGPARNKGLKESSGEYVVFLDPDDFYYSSTALETLYNSVIQNDADMCGGNIASLTNGKIKERFARGSYFDKEEYFEGNYIPIRDGFFWRFIYRLDFLNKNELTFPDYLRAQDLVFLLNCFGQKPKILMIPDHVYTYRIEHRTLKWNERKLRDWLKGLRDAILICREKNFDEFIYHKIKWAKTYWIEILNEAKIHNIDLSRLIDEINSAIDFEKINSDFHDNLIPFFQGFYVYPSSMGESVNVVVDCTNEILKLDKLSSFLATNISTNFNYDFVLLMKTSILNFENKIKVLLSNYPNVNIRIYNLRLSELIFDGLKSDCKSVELNQIFFNYKKIIYVKNLQSFNCDFSKLAKIDVSGFHMIFLDKNVKHHSRQFEGQRYNQHLDFKFLILNLDKINRDGHRLSALSQNIFKDLNLVNDPKQKLSIHFIEIENLVLDEGRAMASHSVNSHFISSYFTKLNYILELRVGYWMDLLRYKLMILISSPRKKNKYRKKILLLNI